MSDLISRQAAIDAVEKSMYENPHENEIHRGMHDHEHRYFLTILMGLPSAQPEIEPKTGHWIANDDYDGEVYYTCSRCEEPWVTIDGTPQENGMKYCPHCGAKMEGGTE